MKGKFFRCGVCGNTIYLMNGDAGNIRCCGKEMEELMPGTSDASSEKHVPDVAEHDGSLIVKVGSVLHPMTESHYIEWVAAENADGNMHIKYLKPGESPEVSFCCHHSRISRVYAYCNIHGLWCRDIAKK